MSPGTMCAVIGGGPPHPSTVTEDAARASVRSGKASLRESLRFMPPDFSTSWLRRRVVAIAPRLVLEHGPVTHLALLPAAARSGVVSPDLRPVAGSRLRARARLGRRPPGRRGGARRRSLIVRVELGAVA